MAKTRERPEGWVEISEALIPCMLLDGKDLTVLAEKGKMPQKWADEGILWCANYQIAARVVFKAMQGDDKAVTFIAERTEGKVPDKVVHDATQMRGVLLLPMKELDRDAWERAYGGDKMLPPVEVEVVKKEDAVADQPEPGN